MKKDNEKGPCRVGGGFRVSVQSFLTAAFSLF